MTPEIYNVALNCVTLLCKNIESDQKFLKMILEKNFEAINKINIMIEKIIENQSDNIKLILGIKSFISIQCSFINTQNSNLLLYNSLYN